MKVKAKRLVFATIFIGISLLSLLSLNVHIFANTTNLASSSNAALNNATSSSDMMAKATHVLVGTVEQTATFSGDVAEAALAPVEMEVALGLSILVLLFAFCVLAGALVVLLFLGTTRNRHLVASLGVESNV